MNWILIGYIVTIVINYVILKKVRRTTKDCPGCAYKHCSRHYTWNDVIAIGILSLLGPIALVLISGLWIIDVILQVNPKPPKWL